MYFMLVSVLLPHLRVNSLTAIREIVIDPYDLLTGYKSPPLAAMIGMATRSPSGCNFFQFNHRKTHVSQPIGEKLQEPVQN
jgi:hypothetical protein